MVKLNKIYTRTGDDGTTGLGTGERRLKSDLRVEAYGTVDEANSCIGLARLHTAPAHPDIDAMLARIQNDLFDLGADLATPDDGKPLGYEPLRIVASQTDAHRSRDRRAERRPAAAAILRPARRLAGRRRAASGPHRRPPRRAHHGGAGARARRAGQSRRRLRYINRVSDFLFVAARAVNDNGNADVLWVPGKNR